MLAKMAIATFAIICYLNSPEIEGIKSEYLRDFINGGFFVLVKYLCVNLC